MGSTKHVLQKRNWNIGLENFEESCRGPNVKIEIQVKTLLVSFLLGLKVRHEI